MWARAVLSCAVLCACARAWPGGAVCARRSVGAGGARYVSFLGGAGGPGPSALVESAWGARGRLRACWARRDPRLARAFRAACARSPRLDSGAALRRDLDALWRRRGACASPTPPGRLSRRPRGWTVPGTLWCGAGDSAGHAGELGLFRGPDRCCREHDQCSAQIAALQFSYGIRNYRLHTVSHCDCDARFRQCLLALNDTISDIIGVTFFDLLEMPCFVLEETEQCVQWHWWGGCERYGVVPLARMVQQSQYHYSLPAEGPGSPAVQPPGKGKKRSRAGRKRLQQGLGQNPGRHQSPASAQQTLDLGTVSPALTRDEAEPTSSHSAAQSGLEPGPPTAMTVLGQDLGAGGSAPSACTACPGNGTTGPSQATERSRDTPVPAIEKGRREGPGRVCRGYKRLDQCEHQIAPHEVKYHLHNAGTWTLFHCNCTHRLVRFLRRVRGISDVEVADLAHRIAMDCFVLEPSTDCSLDNGSQHNCSTATQAVLVPTQHLKKTLRRQGLLHATSKTEHSHWKTQDSGATLYEQCLQLALEQKSGTRHHHTVPR
ncbi:group 3 secretory phospholipase A2 [Heliangelus exortis]|uniref:group 3 secretory phospholipase A2 n=1 Tax=Heliangelus exortis TaxID=472823 RepID=UPI003A8E1924